MRKHGTIGGSSCRRYRSAPPRESPAVACGRPRSGRPRRWCDARPAQTPRRRLCRRARRGLARRGAAPAQAGASEHRRCRGGPPL